MADSGGLTFDTLVDDRNYALGGSERARAENQALINELDRKKRARQMAVPTDDNRVKARLREIGEPITLFGERAADRRDRLIYVLSQIQVARGDDDIEMEDESSSSDEEKEEEFYTEGSLELLEARRRIAEYSLPRAQLRVAQQREESRLPLGKIIDVRKRVFGEIKKFTTFGSQIGDERPISQVRFSPDGKLLATGSWSGNVKLWNVPACDLATSLRAHGDRIGGVAWHPQATLSQSAESVNLVTGGADCEVSLWSLKSDKALHTFKGHTDRVCRVAFHPSGHYVASASYDGSWRLWDASTGQSSGKHTIKDQDRQLLFQEGHSKEVYAVQFQDDGALVASGGLDAIGRVWDLRTGRTAMVLDGHGQAIYGMDFSPNGYQIATGSGDNTVRIWDMRSLRALYTIGAHTSIVSDVSFYRPTSGDIFTAFAGSVSDAKMENATDIKKEDTSGDATHEMEDVKPTLDGSKSSGDGAMSVSGLFLVSSGYDGMVKVWSADDWQLVKALSADAGKVMSTSIAPHGELIASGSWNRSYQLFSMED